ncbi:MAG: hypothetical protein AAGF07_00470 [Patescibacteria group bacterium]
MKKMSTSSIVKWCILASLLVLGIVTVFGIISLYQFTNKNKTLESTAYTTLYSFNTNESNGYLNVNTVTQNNSEVRSRDRDGNPSTTFIERKLESTLEQKSGYFMLERFLRGDIEESDNPLNNYNSEIVKETEWFGLDCPDPKTSNFVVRENYLADGLSIHVESELYTKSAYFGFPNSNNCYFKTSIIKSEISLNNEIIYSDSNYKYISGVNKIDNQKIAINIRRDRSLFEESSNILLYTTDSGEQWHTISNVYYNRGSTDNFLNNGDVLNFTEQNLDDEEIEYYNNLLTTPNFSFSYFIYSSPNIANHIKDVRLDDEYTVLTYTDGTLECLNTPGINSFYSRGCNKEVYFYTESGKIDIVKTLESITDFPEEIKNMKGKERDTEIAEKYIDKI